MLNRLFVPALVVGFALVTTAPLLIAAAPFEATMGVVQHILCSLSPAWMVMSLAGAVCGLGSARYLVTRPPGSDRAAVAAAELAIVFGLVGLTTGPLWGRKAWGVYW